MGIGVSGLFQKSKNSGAGTVKGRGKITGIFIGISNALSKSQQVTFREVVFFSKKSTGFRVSGCYLVDPRKRQSGRKKTLMLGLSLNPEGQTCSLYG